MQEQHARTAMMLGNEALERLHSARVIVFGVGGVGGYAVEALARCGVGNLDLVDSDTVAPSNLNRQIIATQGTLGMLKVEAARDRILSIDPDIQVRIHPMFVLPETLDQFDFQAYDYVVDAIDTVKSKIALAERATSAGTPIISCMGAGNKLDPSRFEVADISETSVCPLARVMRQELRRRGILHLPVVYSKEPPVHVSVRGEGETRSTPGSISFVPGAAGLVLAGKVILDLTEGLRC